MSNKKNKKSFREMIQKNRWLKKVPNTLTIFNSLCGFGAILYTLRVYDVEFDKNPEYILAVGAWMILGAMIFDMLDGFTARIFNAASMRGMQMDSLADMVTFGVAPAVLVAIMAHKWRINIPYPYPIVWSCCAIYIGCAASRLAEYNVHFLLEKKSSDKFSGLPAPGAAAAICSIIIFFNMQDSEINRHLLITLPIYSAALGLLMVSSISYQHMGKFLFSIRRNRNRLLLVAVIVIGMLVKPKIVTVTAVNAYIFSGPFFLFMKKIGVLKDTNQRKNI